MAEALRSKADLGELLKDATLFKQAAYVDGQWITSGATLAVRNPATGEVLGHVPDLGADATHRAIAAAEAALPQWRALPAAKRSSLLEAWFTAISETTDDLARILTVEQGKPLAESRGEINYGAGFVKWFAEEAKRVNVESITSHLPGAEMMVRREPLGVV